MSNRVFLFDTTLRDGAQTEGVDFSLADKRAIALALDELGIDYIEGGWPGANPVDDQFFQTKPGFARARFTAFGMTRRPGRSAQNDPGLAALVNSVAPVVTLVGKASAFQVETALGLDPSENLAMIGESIAHLATAQKEPIYDAEHFFDGYKQNPAYALDCLQSAYKAGARWIVLCDTNGGTLPGEVHKITKEVCAHIPGSHVGIHTHNDTDCAVANSLAAVEAGARMVQGTINGLGERCGNANIISLVADLSLKMGVDCGVKKDALARLTPLSRLLDERLNRAPNPYQPWVGHSAFAHKGGLHASAVIKKPETYEHIDPASVGNKRHIVVSNQSGRSNLVSRLSEAGIKMDKARVDRLLGEIKELESQGYAYDGADASFELLARREAGEVFDFFKITRFRVIDERRINAANREINESEATVWLSVNGQDVLHVAVGNGPVNAMDKAIRQALVPHYPVLEQMQLEDYKVRILMPGPGHSGTEAVTRVIIESADHGSHRWQTLGVSSNIISASVQALSDAITYYLAQDAGFQSGKARSGSVKLAQ